jgi:hypothetical protein
MTILSKSDPYSHFNATNSKCYNKLFEGMETREEGFEDDQQDNAIGFMPDFQDGLPADPPPPREFIEQIDMNINNREQARRNRDRFADADIDDVNFDQYAFADEDEDFDDDDYEDEDYGGFRDWDEDEDDE